MVVKILHIIWQNVLYEKMDSEAVVAAWPSRQSGHCFRAADETWPTWLE